MVLGVGEGPGCHLVLSQLLWSIVSGRDCMAEQVGLHFPCRIRSTAVSKQLFTYTFHANLIQGFVKHHVKSFAIGLDHFICNSV